MSVDPTLQELLEVQEYFNLPSPALVEKDYYVTKALIAISSAGIEPYNLVFGGGTSLCRAHRLIKRMSEDIDLKIVGEREPSRSELRSIRDHITEALLTAGFLFDPNNRDHRDSRNESRYTIFRLPYTPLLRGEGVLRPEIQIEVAVWPLRLPTINLPIRSFVAEAYVRPPEIENFACVSITQTVAEKFVALTRRTAAEISDVVGHRDPTLVRHIYDLHITRLHYNPSEVVALVKTIIPHDASVFGNQFPAYRDNPMAETIRAITALQTDQEYGIRYAGFQRDMVYGEPADYSDCLCTLKELSEFLV